MPSTYFHTNCSLGGGFLPLHKLESNQTQLRFKGKLISSSINNL